MNLPLKMISLGAACLVLALFAAGAEMKFALPPETAKLKPGTGVELANAQCILCHSVDYISTQPRLNAIQWKAAVLKMQSKYGAPIQTNSLEALVGYLVKNYGTETPAAK